MVIYFGISTKMPHGEITAFFLLRGSLSDSYVDLLFSIPFLVGKICHNVVKKYSGCCHCFTSSLDTASHSLCIPGVCFVLIPLPDAVSISCRPNTSAERVSAAISGSGVRARPLKASSSCIAAKHGPGNAEHAAARQSPLVVAAAPRRRRRRRRWRSLNLVGGVPARGDRTVRTGASTRVHRFYRGVYC